MPDPTPQWRQQLAAALPGARARSAARREGADVEERAREMLAAATPGPWTVVTYGDGDSLAIHDARGDWRVCFMATPSKDGDLEGIEANAELICFLRNNADALVASLSPQEIRNGALREAHTAMACAIAFCGRGPGGTNNRSPKKWAAMCSQIADLLVKADQRVLEAISTPQSEDAGR